MWTLSFMRWAGHGLEVDPDVIKRRVRRWRDRGVDTPAALRAKSARYHARRVAVRGFATALLPRGVLGSVMNVVDTRGVAKHQALLTAEYAYIQDDRFFERPEYALAIAKSLNDGELLLTAAGVAETQLYTALSLQAKASALRAVRGRALRWLGNGLAQGRRSMIPTLVAATASAAWNYAELRWTARRYNGGVRVVGNSVFSSTANHAVEAEMTHAESS
jgi:hypothetical protein